MRPSLDLDRVNSAIAEPSCGTDNDFSETEPETRPSSPQAENKRARTSNREEADFFRKGEEGSYAGGPADPAVLAAFEEVRSETMPPIAVPTPRQMARRRHFTRGVAFAVAGCLGLLVVGLIRTNAADAKGIEADHGAAMAAPVDREIDGKLAQPQAPGVVPVGEPPQTVVEETGNDEGPSSESAAKKPAKVVAPSVKDETRSGNNKKVAASSTGGAKVAVESVQKAEPRPESNKAAAPPASLPPAAVQQQPSVAAAALPLPPKPAAPAPVAPQETQGNVPTASF